MVAETRGLAMLADKMVFFGDVFKDIFGNRALKEIPKVSLKASGVRWPAKVVTDARHVYDKLAKETG
eukprot:448390-Prorocentrum_lima.AAC.1